MIHLKINDVKHAIPTIWQEVTFKQYIEYSKIKKPQFIDAVAVFTGIDRDVWLNSKQIENFYLIVDALKFLEKEPKLDKIGNPGRVTITRKDGEKIIEQEYDVPQGLENYTVKQFEDMRGLIRREQKSKELTRAIYPKIISIYFCVLIFGEYTIKNIGKTEPLIEALTLYEVAGMGNFFLRSFNELSNGTPKGKRMWRMIVRRLRRVFTGSMSGDFLMF